MPSGTYVHLDGGVEEHFQCAPGPAGWRYVGERTDGSRTDLTTDSRWRQVRVEISSAGRLIRAGASGRELLWVHHAPPGAPAEHTAEAAGLLGESPGFLVAVARSLRLEPGRHADVRLVRATGPALGALTVEQRWRLAGTSTHETELRPLLVEHFEITDLATAETEEVALAGDVVLAAPGIELIALESPPNEVGRPADAGGPAEGH